jgi:hypothetical protein
MKHPALPCVLVAVVACDGGTVPDDAPTAPDLSCEAIPDPHCANPIDHALIPKLRALGVPIRQAGADELCRRMAIDLIGRGPTAGEREQCASQTPAQIADMFMADPFYTRTQRRAWGELFKYEDPNTNTADLIDLDKLVGEAYAGTIDYAEFATQVAMHPALEALHPGDSWTSYVWQIFLGRPARQDEIEAMRPMTLGWQARSYCDGAIWWNHYHQAIVQGQAEAAAMLIGDMACWNVAKVEWGMNLCLCQPGFFSKGCESDTLGKQVKLSGACPNPANYADPVNYMRVSERTPGNGTCPDGTSRAECNDRLNDYSVMYHFLPFYPWNPPSAQLTSELRSIGDALKVRGDFWEAGIDREVHKLLGWWQTTFRHPDSDLPEIRTVLADELERTGSLRDVQKLIVTSLLYTQPAAAPEVPDVDAMPPWVAGPTKLLSGESWLQTAALGVGETASRCDFRWVAIGYYAPIWADPRDVDNYGGSLDTLIYNGYSISAIVKLAGCNTDSKRPEVSNIGLAFNQNDIARTLCAYGSGVTPPGWSGDLAEAATGLIAKLWHRAPAAGEAEAMVTEMTACMAAGGTTGCADASTAARWLCQRMIDSAEFATY